VGGVRILFAGSPAVALPALEAVADVASEIAVMSQPDKPVGRKKILTPTPVSSWALEHGHTLYRPVDNEGIAEATAEFTPDLGITVAYGRILRPQALAIPPLGWWNVHFSLLPTWRGAAPVQNALLAGDTETGVTVFQLDEGMDTGPVLSQRSHAIASGITAGQLLDELSDIGAALLTETIQRHLSGLLTATPQVGEPLHAPKLERDSGRIRSSEPIEMARRRFQAATPEPGCFVTFNQGEQTLRILAAHTMSDSTGQTVGTIHQSEHGVGIALPGGVMLLETVQPAGKKAMPAADWWRGVHEEIRIDG
jgi:methionyl-tRNA formyltransferase